MPRSCGVAACVLFLLFSFTTQSPARSETKVEQYSATAFLTGITTPPTSIQNTIPYDFYVYSYTPDDEFQNLVNVFNSQGDVAFEKVFSKLKERGRLPASFHATQTSIKLVRSTTSGNETVIRMAMERLQSHEELTSNSALSKYRFTVVELHVDAQGKGEGTMTYAAKLRFNKEGEWEIESYSAELISLRNVRKLK